MRTTLTFAQELTSALDDVSSFLFVCFCFFNWIGSEEEGLVSTEEDKMR